MPIRWVPVRDPDGRFDPQALLCTDPGQAALTVVSWFVRRCQVEVTFKEARAHLGVESQRQWGDAAIARTTPRLFGLFSLVTLLAHRRVRRGTLPLPKAAWYAKERPTFAEALAAVRRHCWATVSFRISGPQGDAAKLPKPLWECVAYALRRAA